MKLKFNVSILYAFIMQSYDSIRIVLYSCN